MEILYLIGEKKYYQHFHGGFKRLIPSRLIPAVRTRILDSIKDSGHDTIVRIGVILLNWKRLDEKGIVKGYISAIDRLKSQNTYKVVLEDLELFHMEDLTLIEDATGLQISKGRGTFIDYLPYILNEIYNRLGENLREKEVLIVGNDVELTRGVIRALHKDIGFITLAGDYDHVIDLLYEYAIEETGLSLFYSKDIDKLLTNYSIIVNLRDKNYLNMNRLRRRAILFDCSISKTLKKESKYYKEINIIDDLLFIRDQDNSLWSKYIDPIIPTYIHEGLNSYGPISLMGVSLGGQSYSLDDFVDCRLRKRRAL